jgi:nucleoside-diphosphate-sugar epimerase
MALTGIALVTGGAGFIGSHIAATLAARGARVRIIDDLSTGHLENIAEIGGDVDFVHASLNDEDALRRALAGVEVVFHEAAIPSVSRSVDDPRTTHEACVDTTFALLLAARAAGVRRVVYAASSSAYGDQPVLPKVETMPPDPLSPYAVAKLVGEYYCQVFTRVYGLETVSLRYCNVFGPRQDPSSQYSGVISRFISALLGDETPVIYGDGEQSRDFTYVANAVEANLRAAESTRAVGQVINVANGERITLNELLATLKRITGRADAEARYEPARIGDVRHSFADITRARTLLGYEPRVGLEEGLQKTIEWLHKSRFNITQQAARIVPSCFISYSSKDEKFAYQLYNDLLNEGVPCWFAPEDLKIGEKFRDRIDESIRLHDKLLLVLSESSVASSWVENEVETALEKEREQGKIVLFPVRLDKAVTELKSGWAADVRRSRHIGDFTEWKQHDSYKKAFDRLMRDLKAEVGK